MNQSVYLIYRQEYIINFTIHSTDGYLQTTVRYSSCTRSTLKNKINQFQFQFKFFFIFINEYLKTVNNPVINGGYYVGYYVSVYEHTPGECVYASE